MHQLPALLGHEPVKVTPEAGATILGIEAEVTAAYQTGSYIDWLDILDRALSLAGLMVTVSSDTNEACIQGAHDPSQMKGQL